MHTELISILAVGTVVRAVTTSVLIFIIPLVVSTSACITWFAVGFYVTVSIVVVTYLIDTCFTHSWSYMCGISKLVVGSTQFTVVLSISTAYVTSVDTDWATIIWGSHASEIAFTA
jgi:hypothetical protein